MHLSRGFLPYAETRNIMMMVAGYQCSVWSHDMLHMIYEEELRTGRFRYCSLSICNGCGWASPRLTQSASGCVIAAHILDEIQNRRFTPRLFITDRASSEIKGPLERQIKDLNVIHNHANWEDLKRQQNQAREQFREESKQVDEENNEDPIDYNDKTVQNLPQERESYS